MLSIIIVNYFGKEILQQCVASVLKYTKGISYELIIIDNANDEITKQLVMQLNPNINWISMGYNAGFGRAMNRGFEHMKGDVALLLNPDCIAQDDAIAACYHSFKNSNYGACGIQLTNEDGSFQISGNYAVTGGLNYLLPLPYIGPTIKKLGTLGGVKKPHITATKDETIVDWISGAFLMVKKEVIDVTGGFDEDFFLFGEEAEWCSRMRKIAPLVIYGKYKIQHAMGALTTEAFGGASNSYYTLHDKKGLQIMLSNMLRIRKEFGLAWYCFLLFFYAISVPIWLLMGSIESAFTLSNKLQHFQNYSSNIFKLLSFTPKIARNRPYFYKVL